MRSRSEAPEALQMMIRGRIALSRLKKGLNMRFIIFNITLALCLVPLAGCSSTSPVVEKSRLASYATECPPLEGSPDCQDGHQVDLR